MVVSTTKISVKHENYSRTTIIRTHRRRKKKSSKYRDSFIRKYYRKGQLKSVRIIKFALGGVELWGWTVQTVHKKSIYS